MVEFCKCGGIMVPKKINGKMYLVCRKCGRKKPISGRKGFKITMTTKKTEKIVVLDKKSKFEALPKTEVQCPKCGNMEAYWWMEQTRAADEPPTRFFKCTKCGHVWREYE